VPWPPDAQHALAGLGLQLDAHQLRRLERYESLLRERGARLNLVSARDYDQLFDRHIFDSLTGFAAARWDSANVVDIGSGAGFPAIPLAIACPSARFTLVERTRKRATFIQHAVTVLEIANAGAVWSDIEQLAGAAASIVTARAVADTSGVLEMAGHLLQEGGRALLWQSADQFEREPTPSGWTARWHPTQSRDDAERGIRVAWREDGTDAQQSEETS